MNKMENDIIAFAYQLLKCNIITLEEYNKVVKVVVNDHLSDIERLIDK